MIKYYYRFITKRVPINRFGKLGYKMVKEWFITEDENFVNRANYRKQIKFTEGKFETDTTLMELLQEGFHVDYIYEQGDIDGNK